MLDDPRSAILGTTLILKFGLDGLSILRYRDFYISLFWPEIAYSRPFFEV